MVLKNSPVIYVAQVSGILTCAKQYALPSSKGEGGGNNCSINTVRS